MRRLVAGLALGLWGLSASAGPVSLSVAEMRAFGSEALTRGFADQALAVAEALLQRDAGDSLALVLKAQALRLRGELQASEAAAREAWMAADTAAEKYGAATALAQALSLQDKRTRAQYWLRQAVQNAPNPGTRAQALQDFDYVRSENPLRLRFDASVRPSNNVNGGARDPLFEYQGIPFILSGDALALSGLSLGLGVSGSYRLAIGPASETALTFAASQQGVILSDEARGLATTARNGDYALGNVEIGLQRQITLPMGTLTAALGAGHSWYGGRDLSDSLTLTLGLDRNLSQTSALTLEGTLRHQMRQDQPSASSDEIGLGARLTRRGPGGDTWQLGLDLLHVASGLPEIAHDEATLTLGWQAARPVAGLGLGATLSARAADYEGSRLPGIARQDRRIAASLSATLQNLTYLGFAPVLSLDMARNDSNLAIYSTETTGLSLTVRSRF